MNVMETANVMTQRIVLLPFSSASWVLKLHLELHEVSLEQQSDNMNLPALQQSSASSLSGNLNYGTPSQQGGSVYIKEPGDAWDIALGTGPSQSSCLSGTETTWTLM